MASTAVSVGRGVLAEWRELESDPGLFSLLVEDFGVRGVKVEEVYDISKKFEGKVYYGFVFLFRWEGDRRARKKSLATEDSYVMDSGVVNRMFFAHQIVNNSCATHALLSVLLNCSDMDLGPTLTRLQEFSAGLDPESKGFAIANMSELARSHNKHAKPLHIAPPPPGGRRGSVMSSAHALLPETYHFVSYVPINDRLFELDGLKEFPIDHGPWGEQEEWTDLFQRVISQRLTGTEDILYNLMAVVPDPVPKLSEQLKSLQAEQKELLEQAVQLAKEKIGNSEQNNLEGKEEEEAKTRIKGEPEILGGVARALPSDQKGLEEVAKREISETSTIDEKLDIVVAQVVSNDQELESCKQKLREEFETKQRYRIEFSRRTHNYDPLISQFIKTLALNGKLPSRLIRRPSNATPSRSLAGQKRGSVSSQSGKNDQSKNKKPKTTLLVNGAQVVV